MNTRSSACWAGARPGYFTLENVQAMIGRRSTCGTTKPKASDRKSTRLPYRTLFRSHDHEQQRVLGGGAARILHAGERAGDDRPPLDLRDHEAETLERMPDVPAPIGQGDGGGGGVGDPVEQVREARIDVAQEPRGLMRLRRQDQGVRLD